MHYPPPHHGAAAVGQYIRESERINNSFSCKYINLGISASVDEIGKFEPLKWLRYCKILGKTIKNLIFFRPDVVYLTLTAYGLGFYKDALVAYIPKLLGKKVVYHFHNKGVVLRQDRWFDNLLYRLVFRNAEVILLSKNLYTDVKKYVPENKVHYCANGIPEFFGSKNNSKRYETDISKVKILFLSNLLKVKGVFFLLNACRILKDKGLNFKCFFVGAEGDISVKEFEDKLSTLNILDVVSYKGPKYNEEKEKEYAEADIFVLPSYVETFGLVNVEAMQFSLPVVSTFEGGIPDVVENGITGFLVPPKNASALADKLEILINDSQSRLGMGESGRLRYEKLFTLEMFETRFYNIMDKLV